MKVTRLGPTRPTLSIGSIIGGGTAPGGTESPAPPGHVPTSNGSNGVSWGSNVGTITVNGTTLVQGPFVNIADGSNTTVSASSNTIRVHATSAGIRPLMAFEPSIANYLVVVDGDGTAVMVSD